MAYISIVGGKIIKTTGGSYNMYAKESIVFNSNKKITETAENGITFGKPQKAPKLEITDVNVTKVEGPFDKDRQLVKEVKAGELYSYIATPSRKPTDFELRLLNWAVKNDDEELHKLPGVSSLNKLLQDGTIALAIRIRDCEKARVYAYFNYPSKKVSVEVVLKKIIKVKHKLIGKTERDPGYNKDRTQAEDMMYGDKPSKSVSITKDKMFSYKNNTLGAYLDQLMTSLSIRDMETVALEMASKFKNGTGGTYTSSVLDKEIENNPATITFHNDFLNTFKNELHLVKYDPNVMKIIPMKLLNFSSFWDKASGLGITIHQVWSVKAEINNYIYDAATGKWDCELVYTFYDHYGLDWEDIIKHGEDRIPQYETGNCFKAWYILQHYRNAKPFITEMTKKEKISGN